MLPSPNYFKTEPDAPKSPTRILAEHITNLATMSFLLSMMGGKDNERLKAEAMKLVDDTEAAINDFLTQRDQQS